MKLTPRAALICAAVGLAIIALMFVIYGNQEKDGGNAPKIRTVILESVSNASGLIIIEHEGQRFAATVDEVPEWNRKEAPPPLITWSSIHDGSMRGGEGRVAEYGEVEALAHIDGRAVFPYKTGRQSVVVRDGNQDIPLITTATLKQLHKKAAKLASGPLFFEFEGLAYFAGGWELLVSVVRPNVQDTPKSTMAVFRMSFSRDGKLETISEDGLAIVPGFHGRGVSLVDNNGRIVHKIDLPTSRVEGVFWDAKNHELFLVRECVGAGTACRDGVHFGVKLWIASFPNGLLPKD
ncbi:MAG TPA: hypothetical protein EYN66_05750 [Myxococcales bacterium]|nr:hypothetical protein [Myxococcales bacterium]